jgi:5'-3' exonuclease
MNNIDLIIDSNFILNKLVFNLFKEKRLYVDLENELKMNYNSLYKLFNFSEIYIISDSNKSSWRKKLYPAYKEKRQKDVNIDWGFVYEVFYNFLDNQKKKSYRYDNIEADDFIAKIVQRNNLKGISNLIISNDHDLKQLLFYDKTNKCINIMANEFKSIKEKVFLPHDYKLYLSDSFNNTNNISDVDIIDIESFDNNPHNFIDKYIRYKNIDEVYASESLFIKLISGDKSDNISSIYTKNKRGIGAKGAKKIYDFFVSEYGIPTFNDDIVNNNVLFDDIVDIVMEAKKIKSTDFNIILDNLNFNFKLISLKKLPPDIEKTIYNII